MPLRPVPRAARYLPATADLRHSLLQPGTIAFRLPNGWIYVSHGWPVSAPHLRPDAALAVQTHVLRFADTAPGRSAPALHSPSPEDAAAYECSRTVPIGDRPPPIPPSVLAALRGLAWDRLQDAWQRPLDAALASIGYPAARMDVAAAWQRGRGDLATEQTVQLVNALGARTYESQATPDSSLAYAAMLRAWSHEWTRRLPTGTADATTRRVFAESRMHDFLTHVLQLLDRIATTQPERRTDFLFLFRVRAVLAVAAAVVAAGCLPNIAASTVAAHQHTYRPAETDTLLLHYRWSLEIGAFDWARELATDIGHAAPTRDPSADFTLLARLCEELTNTEYGPVAHPLTPQELRRGRAFLCALLPHATNDAANALRALIHLTTDDPFDRAS